MNAAGDLNQIDIAPYCEMICRRSGIHLDESRGDILIRALRHLAVKRGLGPDADLLQLLGRDQSAFADFLNLITVNETYFFREAAYLDIVTRRLIPELLERRNPGEKIRILSAGCSSGEEVYSLAMTLLECFGPTGTARFSITGIDIDSDAVGAARAGVYTRRSFRGRDAGFMETWFETLGAGQYRVQERLREVVDFYIVNLLDPLPDALNAFDIIFYRNVSIYFKEEVQKRIFVSLADILNEKGYLILSATETLSHDLGVLKLVEMDGYFLFRKLNDDGEDVHQPREKNSAAKACRCARPAVTVPKTLRPRSPRGFCAGGATVSAEQEEPEVTEAPESLLERVLLSAAHKDYENALQLIDRLLGQGADIMRAKAIKAEILFNLDRLEDSEEVCLEITAKDPMRMEAYLISGLIHKRKQDLDMAASLLKRAIYLRNDSWLAHFHMAEIHQEKAEYRRAAASYRMAMRCLEEAGYEQHGLAVFSGTFSRRDVLHLCEQRLSSIDSRRSHGV